MPQNKIVRIGPIALTAVLTTNILNATITSLAGPVGLVLTQPFLLIKRIRIVNKTAGAGTFSLFLGATGGNVAGTEVIGTAKSVPGNDAFDWNGQMRMDVADFLVGGASAGATLTFEAEAELGFI